MQVGWIDFSPEERSRTLTVLSSLSEPGSVDELGIGIVRDAMADKLFPGTSTLLTKARYFFLVPYLSRYLEEGHDNTRQDPRILRNSFRDLERACARGLRSSERARGHSDEGIIGRVALASGKWVARGPGEIYWASLRALGFMRQGAPDSYQAQFAYLADARMRDRQYRNVSAEGDEGDGLSDDKLALGSMWNLPRESYGDWRKAWEKWDSEASIALTHEEAVFLRNRIVASRPDSLYALILTDEELRRIALASIYGEGGTSGDSSLHEFLSHGLARMRDLSPELARSCAIADGFSELVFGCRIAYNMQLSGLEESGANEWEGFTPRAAEVAHGVDLDDVGRELNLSWHPGFQTLRAFLLRSAACMESGDLDGLKEQVRRREAAIKGTRRKIGAKNSGDFAWRGGHRLPYRFANAMAIVREIEEAGGCDA
jgi:hypothetical protein